MKQVIIFLFAIPFFIYTGKAQNVGEIAPDFTLKSLNNQDYTLSESRGNVVLVFLVGYNCPLCIASAPTVKSEIIDAYISNPRFLSLIIDTWDGSASAFQNFRNTTNLPGVYLQKGSKVATNWATTYDRLVVIDAEGKMVFKGNTAASSNVAGAKQAIDTALDQLTTFTDNPELTGHFKITNVYPNPFSTESTIQFYLPEPGTVSIKILDITGKEAGKPISQFFPANENSVKLFREDLKQGIYFLRLQADGYSATYKIVVK